MDSSWDKAVQDFKAMTARALSAPQLQPASRARGATAVVATVAAVSALVAVVAVLLPSRLGAHQGTAGRELTSPSPSAASYPPDVYAPAASFPDWGSPGGCPSGEGLSVPDPLDATQQALMVINERGSTLDSNKAAADPAYWPVVDGKFAGSPTSEPFRTLVKSDVTGAPASTSIDADLIRHWCGDFVLAHSWSVTDAPSTTPALATTFYVVVRRGRYLVWRTNP